MEKTQINQDIDSVAIVGTGNFACAIGRCLLAHNYSVVFGSRFPEQRHLKDIDSTFSDVAVEEISQCVQSADVVFLCIHHEHHNLLKNHENILRNKIVIDVSNQNKTPNKDDESSIAEKLASLLPGSYIVKGFNTLSAYAIMDNEKAGESKVVYVCGDNVLAKERVIQIARTCGLTAIDKGFLSNAREIERMPHNLCGGWCYALIITLIVFLFWLIYGMLRFYVFKKDKYTWSRFPMNFLNKVFGSVGITLLSFCYLPGCFAAFIQLTKGTKYIMFPVWLDKWLKSRKYLGLLALLMTCIHVFNSTILMNAQYYHSFYESKYVIVSVNGTEDAKIYTDSRMNWRGELSVSFGIISIVLMVLIGITTLPSVGSQMNWRQWNLIHSHVGFICLLISTIHVIIKGTYSWMKDDVSDFVAGMSFISCFIPYFVLLARMILYLPCINSYVTKIRKGWQRKQKVNEDVERVNTNEVKESRNEII